MNRKKVSFEEALKQLETIAEQIEQGQIGLEESIEKYEQGMALVKQCRDILSRAELRIEQLQDGDHGKLEAKPLELPNNGGNDEPE
jgi:exodeoxyribonuclease VII small subunit